MFTGAFIVFSFRHGWRFVFLFLSLFLFGHIILSFLWNCRYNDGDYVGSHSGRFVDAECEPGILRRRPHAGTASQARFSSRTASDACAGGSVSAARDWSPDLSTCGAKKKKILKNAFGNAGGPLPCCAFRDGKMIM